jgi:Ran GTPase-activating protein (RanGAP) involved in mRNA processing and transport
MSTKAILFAVANIECLNLSENFLDTDGARAFSEFLSTNQSLKVLKMNGCKLNDKSLEMMLEALNKNPSLQLSELHMARNDFSDSNLLS